MSTTASDPLATLGSLPGVPDAVDSVRKAVDRVYGHRVMRRRSNEITAEAALRGSRGSAALAGAVWNLEEVRRRTDFSGEDEARVVGAALRLTAEAGQLLSIWRQSPLRVLARLHLVAAGGAAPDDAVGRPRLAGEPVDEPLIEARLPDADEVAGRLEGLSQLIIAGTAAPALVTAAVVHGELLALRPFGSHNGLVARTAERIVLIGSGLDPKSVCPAEVGHAEQGGRHTSRPSRGTRRGPRRAWPHGSRTAVGRWGSECASRRRSARPCSAARLRSRRSGVGRGGPGG